MKFKPLLILIPCIIIIGILFFVEKHNEKPVIGDENGNEKKVQTEIIKLDLAIGQTGSLDDDVGEPVYNQPDSDSEQLGTLQYNCCAVVNKDDTTKNTQWLAIDLSEGKIGYVSREAVMRKQIEISDDDNIRMEIVKNAITYLGLDFVRYGTSLEEGIDCSNFVQQIYAKSNIQIPNTCNEIITHGNNIPKKVARPGDVVYYDVNNGYGHVGMYLADGFLINSTGHAGKTYPDGGVRICKLRYRDREECSIYDIVQSGREK